MNLSSQTICSSSSDHLINELKFRLKFSSLGSQTKFNGLIFKSNMELYSSWFGLLPALPIVVSYSMTINKSQGQLLDWVGLYLPKDVFSDKYMSRSQEWPTKKELKYLFMMRKNKTAQQMLYTKCLLIVSTIYFWSISL